MDVIQAVMDAASQAENPAEFLLSRQGMELCLFVWFVADMFWVIVKFMVLWPIY